MSPTETKTYRELSDLDYTFNLAGYCVHSADTGYGYASGRKLKYPAYRRCADGTYAQVSSSQVEKALAEHNNNTVIADRHGWGIRSS